MQNKSSRREGAFMYQKGRFDRESERSIKRVPFQNSQPTHRRYTNRHHRSTCATCATCTWSNFTIWGWVWIWGDSKTSAYRTLAKLRVRASPGAGRPNGLNAFQAMVFLAQTACSFFKRRFHYSKRTRGGVSPLSCCAQLKSGNTRGKST